MRNQKVWLGAGELPMEGAINVDIRKLPGIDIVADVRKLPFEDEEIEAIGSRNLIEHFARNEIAPLIQEWSRCLKVEGLLQIETVDCGRLMDQWKEIPEENLLDGLLGAQTYEENFHKMIFTKEILERFLIEAGLTIIECDQWIERQIPRIKVKATKLYDKCTPTQL